MGKNSQPKNTNDALNDKTNPSFKWARMLHLLDYHRWHYIKKMLANKKHNEEKNDTGSISVEYVCGPHACVRKEFTERTPVEEQTTDPSYSTKDNSLPSSPRTKSSRAAKIRKLIAKEVTKRRGRHKRSSTCPAGSELATNDDSIHQKPELVDEGVGDLITRDKCPRNSVKEGDRKCGLCNTMQIECQLGDRKQVGEHGDLQLDQINMIVQEIPINKQFYERNFVRSATFQHSKEFLDAMDVLSLNKQFFLRVSDDPGSSLRHHFLTQQSTPSSSKRKSLAKSGTFPISHPSSINGSSSPNLSKRKQGSFTKVNNCNNHTLSEKQSTSLESHMAGTRFKNLRQRLKHVITESRKERRRIAMDAVFHKVPYGQKVLEESNTKDSPYVSSCESNFSSPCSYKKGKNSYRRSPSLDESLDKYCQLFETTNSFNREAYKINTPDRSRLKVMDENSSMRALDRNFSSPDFQVSLSQNSNDYDGHSSSRTPNRGAVSYNERMMQGDTLNMDFESGRKIIDATNENARKEDLEERTNNMQIAIEDSSNKEFDTLNSFDDSSCDDNSSLTDTQPIQITNIGLEFDDQKVLVGLEEARLEDVDSIEEDEPSEESPTFACLKVDEDQVQTLFEPLSPSLHPVKVLSKDEAEFNYVRDILQLSGYSGSQLLGTWYSSQQPVDPSVFVELESCSLIEPNNCLSSKKGNTNNSHLLLFDLINEVLVVIYERSVSYWPQPLSSCSHTHPMPKGYRVLDEVWVFISWYLACSREELNSSLDYIVVHDLAKDDGWMNLQFDAECVGLEVEDLIFDDLLVELLS